MTRVIAGVAGGRTLRTPGGRATRPTTDRVREALFSSLGTMTGARVLDLYAGSGALGLEALSRGAAYATFVEQSAAAVATLRRNISDLGLGGARVCQLDVARFLAKAADAATTDHDGRYDLVFADPPYALDIDAVLSHLPALLAPGGTLVVERATRTPEPSWPAALGERRARRYGETVLWYVRQP